MESKLTVSEVVAAVRAARGQIEGECECSEGDICPHVRLAVLTEVPHLHPDEAEAIALACADGPHVIVTV